jgi:8-oxo-dGTP pyrophosphatase MutT (NUDIX family)
MHSAAMRAGAKDKRESRLTVGWTRVRKYRASTNRPSNRSSAKFVRLAELRKLKECDQVAAVCYRVSDGGVEFLLVRTRKGRWIFPKGSAEPGLSHAQAAALEAFEEAGVHGRMEEASFTRYVRRRRGVVRSSAARVAEKESVVDAHLCQVLRLVPPQELDRNPTWFSAEKAKRRLREDRTPDFGSELARVVDRAVSRIRRPRVRNAPAVRDLPTQGPQVRGLQRVQFIDIGRFRETAGKSKTSRTG